MRALIFILALLVAMLLLAWPAKSQDCVTPDMTMVELDTYTKQNGIQAQAWLWQSAHPAIRLMIVWFSNMPGIVVVSAFKNDCLVVPPSGKSAQAIPIDADVQKAVGEAKRLFDNGARNSPFASY